MLTRFLIPAIAMPAMLAVSPLATPAQALTTLDFSSVGDQGRYEFRGLEGYAGTEDLFAALTLELTSRTSSSLTFSYRIENLAGGEINAARLQSFGFDVDGPLTGRQASGTFDKVSSGDVPGMGHVDACFLTGGNSCSSNSGNGLVLGAPAGSGSFQLSFAAPVSVVTLRDSYVRWRQVRADDLPNQGVSGLSAGMAVEMPLPEPQSWALMVAGFGLVGFALRRGAVRQTVV